MTDGGSLSPADVMAMSNDGMGGNNAFFWIFALLLLGGLGNGGGLYGGGYRPQYATQDFVQNGFNFNDLQDQNRDLLNAVTGGTAQAVAATQQAKYDNINVMKDVQTALSSQIADVKTMEQNILGNQNECCCSTKQLILQSNYDAAMRDAATNANFTAQIQSVKDAMAQDKIESLQSQVASLQLQAQLAGVVRYPMTTTYGVPSPCFGGCGCANV